jgi:hypothetical protein
MATLTLKYPRYPKRIETIAREVADHVDTVRAQRIAEQEVTQVIKRAKRLPDAEDFVALMPEATRFSTPMKLCGGFNRPPHELPLIAENFHYRKRKGSRQRNGSWHPLCRQCKKAKRDYERSLRTQA